MLPDVVGLNRTFDYLVPPGLEDRVEVGTMVRIPLSGRRVGGWVVALADEAATDRPLQPLAKVTGRGPSAEVIELARWAAWRWAGRLPTLLRTASPDRAVVGLPRPPAVTPAPPAVPPPGPQPPPDLAADAFSRRLALVRLAPGADPFDLVMEAARRPDALVLAPSVVTARFLAARLRRAGQAVSLLPDDWARAAAGGDVAIGARAAAWAPRPALGAVLVLDEHDEVYQEERAPTWNARDVVVERARRAGTPCVLTSPCPSLEAMALDVDVLTQSRSDERAGWAAVEVVDRREEPPGLGLWSPRLVALAREARPGARVVCVLNRTGRARLLSCSQCGELSRCPVCGGAMGDVRDGDAVTEAGDDPALVLECSRCRTRGPRLCRSCGSTRLKALRVGVTRAREELELLAGQPVAEVTAITAGLGQDRGADLPPPSVLVGTEAVLHRVAGARVVAFLDFDQELLVPRYRAGEAALALLARAARVVGARAEGGRVLVQTRLPGHEVVDAALHSDPSRFTLVESARRVALGLPPERALAMVSGAGAEAFVAALPFGHGLDVRGPSSGRWLLRAPGHEVLCDTLAAVPRPKARLRVEVDPLRA